MLSVGDVVDVHVASERNDGYLATRRGDHVQVLAWEGEYPYGYRVCLGGHEPWGWLDAGVLKPLEGSEQFEVLVSAERLDGYLATRKGDTVEILHVEAVWVYAKRLDDTVVGWVASNTLNTIPRTDVSYTALQLVAGDQLEYTPNQLPEMGSRAAVAAGTTKVGGVPYKASSSHALSDCTTYASGNRLPESQDQRCFDEQGMLHERYTLAVKGAGLRSKDRPHVEYSKAATFVLRHKRDRQKKVMYNGKNGFMAWETFDLLFSNEVSKRFCTRPHHLIHFRSPHHIIDVLERAVKDVERFEVEYLTNLATRDCRPILIRALQGHSSDDAPHELIAETRVEVTEKNVHVIYHGTSKIGAEHIIRTGQIIPGGGGFSEHEHERKESYFSILHPVTGVARASPGGDPVQYRPYDFHRGVIVHINLQKARQHGCSFWQARSSALTCSEPVPVEAVERYEDAGDH